MPESGIPRFSDVRPPAEEPRASLLAFASPLLTSAAVQGIELALRSERTALPVAIDCQRLREVTAAGLSALLELGRSSSGLRELGLTQLSRELTLVAIAAGLSERFSIYATNEAWLRGVERVEVSPCAP
jgi:ABC-type transporter Mla MlaB component